MHEDRVQTFAYIVVDNFDSVVHLPLAPSLFSPPNLFLNIWEDYSGTGFFP